MSRIVIGAVIVGIGVLVAGILMITVTGIVQAVAVLLGSLGT